MSDPLAQCPECLQYFYARVQQRDGKRHFLIPAHECFIGQVPTKVTDTWCCEEDVLEAFVSQLLDHIGTIPDPTPPSHRPPLDSEPF